MPHVIEYRYQVGETLTYQQVVTMISREGDGDPVGGRAEFEVVQQVTGGNPRGWTVQVQQRLVDSEGILAEHIPENLMDREMTLTMDRRGTLLDTGGGPPPARVAAFPGQPVDRGDSWMVNEAGGPGAPPMQIQYLVERFEEAEGDLQVHLASLARTEDPGQGVVSDVKASTVFSLGAGCQVSSTTVIEMAFDDGRTTQILVENRLVDRQVPASVDLDQVV